MTQVLNLDMLRAAELTATGGQGFTGDVKHREEMERRVYSMKCLFDKALDAVACGDLQVAEQLITQVGEKALHAQQTARRDNVHIPIKIYTLGRFDILIDGKHKISSKKSSPRPIELLKCLITFGSRQVSQFRIIECLWPDMNGDAAMNVFSSTLCRLRGLLGHKNAIKLKSGQLTLNPDFIWVDVWELERKLSRIESFQQTTGQAFTALVDQFDQICQTYKGNFLGEGNEYVWSMGYREKIITRMLNMYRKLGTLFSADQDYERAEQCFSQGIILDPLHESFYRELMQIYYKAGRVSEAAAAYQKCRKQLSSVLGISPSAETVMLYKSLIEKTG